MPVELSGSSWGAHINTTDYAARTIPETCLAWLRPVDKSDWQKRGVVVWNNDSQKIEVMWASHALALLNHLRTTDTWKAEGIPILTQYTVIKLPETSRKKKGRKKGEEAPTTEQEDDSKGQVVVEEQFRLKDAAEQFFDLLQTNESLLQQMAEEDEERKKKIFLDVYSLLFHSARAAEGEKIDFSTRPFEWVQDKNTLTWTCDRPPNRGSVLVSEDNFFWYGCIEQPDRYKHKSHPFVELEPALAWVEQELAEEERKANEPAAEDEAEKWPEVNMADLMTRKRVELADYWIDAADIEPERITYRVIIELDYMPHRFKTEEISFGKQRRYDEKFATPSQLAQELRLDPAQVVIEQPIDSGWYRMRSGVTYYREDVAIAQAQQLWDKSLIVQQYRAGKVIRARYGVQEVETGYDTMIGGCENPDQPYPKPISREEHLARLALRQTLAYALDVEGFRSFLGIPPKHLDDERLLAALHRTRVKSDQIPLEARVESERWLKD